MTIDVCSTRQNKSLMMKRRLARTPKTSLGRRTLAACKAYATVPLVLWQELRRILALLRHGRRYADAPDVLLCKLRTAAHIVDKGLQAPNWAPGHGRDPYQRLSSLSERLRDTPAAADPSYRWAIGIKAAYDVAQAAGVVGADSADQGRPPQFDKDDVLQLIRSRRSIRCFEHRQIPREVLVELADVSSWAPTSCNRQATRLFISQDPKKVRACLAQCAGATCLGANTPCFIAVCADMRFYSVKDRNLPYIDVSLGVQNVLLLAHCHNIEGTILNWMHHTRQEDASLREALQIPEYYSIVLNLVLGYPAKHARIPGRKSVGEAYVVV